MSRTKLTRRRRPAGPFDSVASAARLQLSAIIETRAVRTRHVGALLAFAPEVQWAGGQMHVHFDHGSTAVWASEALPSKDVFVEDFGDAGGAVILTNPQIVLEDFGFRGDRWIFGVGTAAALGISRGAMHAAGGFNKRGLRLACPNTPMMLTLTAVMTRLGIAASPTGGQPRVTVGAADVAVALDRLGIGAIAQDYLRLRDSASAKSAS